MYIQRKRLRTLYEAYKKEKEKREKMNMRENQLKGLISVYANQHLDNELESIENILQSTLPDVIISFQNVKLNGGLIARGGSGIVMKGTLGRNTTIAIKVIQSQMAGDMEEFQSELSMLYTLNHPNIVRFLGISFHEGAIMILQEYCPMNLAEYISKSGPYQQEKPFLDMILTILDTLVFLHDKNIVHQDLKPANILLDKSFAPKICDLGMAKFVSSENDISTYRTKDWQTGTPGYMPPEMTKIRKGDHYSPKYWDVFSTAMVVYYMWTGKHPLHEYENAFIINDEIHKGTRPVLPPKMPQHIREIVRKMWHQNYQERPSIQEVSLKLTNFFHDSTPQTGQKSLRWDEELLSNEEDRQNNIQLSLLNDSLLSN